LVIFSAIWFEIALVIINFTPYEKPL